MSMQMQLLREYALQWGTLILAGAALLAVLRTQRERQTARARKTLTQLLRGALFGLLTQAEKNYGAGTGAIKKSVVLAEMLRLIPPQWRTLIDAEACGALIENALTAAKALWAKTAAKQ